MCMPRARKRDSERIGVGGGGGGTEERAEGVWEKEEEGRYSHTHTRERGRVRARDGGRSDLGTTPSKVADVDDYAPLPRESELFLLLTARDLTFYFLSLSLSRSRASFLSLARPQREGVRSISRRRDADLSHAVSTPRLSYSPSRLKAPASGAF